MNDPLEHATGVEKWELLKQKEGVDVSKDTKSHCLTKNSTLMSRENCRFFWGEKLVKCCGMGLF